MVFIKEDIPRDEGNFSFGHKITKENALRSTCINFEGFWKWVEAKPRQSKTFKWL